jgi:hypothetical protein
MIKFHVYNAKRQGISACTIHHFFSRTEKIVFFQPILSIQTDIIGPKPFTYMNLVGIYKSNFDVKKLKSSTPHPNEWYGQHQILFHRLGSKKGRLS